MRSIRSAATVGDCDTTSTDGVRIGDAWLDCRVKFILQRSMWHHRYPVPIRGAPMSEDWNTKYGPRRVRRDPPTLDEAIFAAIGITDDHQAQAEIAAALMGMPFDAVLA